MRDALVGAILLAAAAAAAGCVIPPPGPPIGPAPPQQAYRTCDPVRDLIATCELAPRDACLAECRADRWDQRFGAEQMDRIARTSCEELAAALSTPKASTAATDPPAAAPPPSTSASPYNVNLAGRWWSEQHVSYTNAAMVSADIYFEITLDSSGDIGGLWGRYICVASAYGSMSCGKGPFDGLVHGKLHATHDGWIDLENLGRSDLAWAVVATSPDKLKIELPSTWQGEENVLFRSTVTRQ
ncbi:MAG TPA: hypothetical protein VM261_28935 [Kofleriaceae bacterium]|nr:hypothetical protein [Kofleriaceae bacterium]